MNVAVAILVPAYSTKKTILFALATMAIVLMLPIMAVFSLGQNALKFLSGSASALDAETKGMYMGGPIDGDTYAWGNCTYWAYAERLWDGHPIPTTWGNANTWDDRSRIDGYLVDHTPTVGAVFQTDAGDLGHVAYVKAVNPSNGEWTITEMNVKGLDIVSERTFSASAAQYYNFIHYKQGAP